MQNEIMDRFDEMEAYIQGKLDRKNEIEFLERLKVDDVFFQDFQLWTKLESWFEDDNFSEIESILNEKIREESQLNNPSHNRHFLVLKQVIKIAACMILLGSFFTLIYKQFYDLDSINGSFTYSKGLFVNSSSDNKTLEILPKYKVSSIDWIIESQIGERDSTYQFIFQEDIPKRILLRVPKIKYSIKDKLSISFSDSLSMFILSIDNKEFILSPAKKWTKLKALPPKF